MTPFHKSYNKANVVEEYKKRFQQILEYTMPNANILGEDDEETDTPDDAEGMPTNDMNNSMGDTPDMGETSNMNTTPDMGGEAMPSDSMDGTDNLTSNFNPEGGNMETPMDNNMAVDTMQPEDEVVDITELTDAQEETQEEIESFDKKFVKAIKAIENIEALIAKNNSKINDKIAEIEYELKKRNPTSAEKMSNRQSISYPYTISPSEYWSEKEKNSNYSTEDDKNGVEQEQFTITKGDINGATDWKSISDSLDNDLLYNQTLDKILKL